jgi:Amt family ammonium transporter
MAITGTFILAFGWFGFNAGSTLAGTDLRLTVAATNTLIASGAGAVAATLYMMWRYGKPDPSMMANGMLAGLVAITAPCAFVNSIAAFIIGAVAGVLVIIAAFFIDQKLKVDDPQNQLVTGDVVKLAETRPVSKTKRWRIVEVVRKAK